MPSSTIEDIMNSVAAAISTLRFEVALHRTHLLLRKYSPDQPRVPAGVPEGGQWTNDDGAHGRLAMARRFKLTPELEQQCDEQFAEDTFHCNMVGSMGCHEQAAVRYGACRNGKYIPPLNYGGTL